MVFAASGVQLLRRSLSAKARWIGASALAQPPTQRCLQPNLRLLASLSGRGVRKDFVDAVGDTPLYYLEGPSKLTGCEIYGKAEFLNPGGSVKDRAAVYIIKDAEERGLKRGGVLVEGTAGNTGIALALIGNSRGYNTVIVIPETQSQEKKDMLRICGAQLVEVPAVPYKDANNYVKYSKRLAEKLAETHPSGAVWGNQFDNVANRLAHYETTGPEIFYQTRGRVNGFVCAVGTGGTLAGVGKYLKEQSQDIKIAMADPHGAALFEYYENGELKSEGESITEGIGQGRITANLENWGLPVKQGGCVDHWYRVSDEESLPFVYDLLEDEGLCLGTSSAINVCGAIKLANEMGPGKIIVTILCDVGTRYQSKLYNVPFLQSSKLPYPKWLSSSHGGSLDVPKVFM